MRTALVAAIGLSASLLTACSPSGPSEGGQGNGTESQPVIVEAAPSPAAVAPPEPEPAAPAPLPEPTPAASGQAEAIQGLWAGEALACNSGEAIRFTATEFMTEGDAGRWQLAGSALTLRSDGTDGGEPVETHLTLVEVTDTQMVWRDFAGQDRRFVRCAP